jgi:hypothetical protein
MEKKKAVKWVGTMVVMKVVYLDDQKVDYLVALMVNC